MEACCSIANKLRSLLTLLGFIKSSSFRLLFTARKLGISKPLKKCNVAWMRRISLFQNTAVYFSCFFVCTNTLEGRDGNQSSCGVAMWPCDSLSRVRPGYSNEGLRLACLDGQMWLPVEWGSRKFPPPSQFRLTWCFSSCSSLIMIKIIIN